MAQEEVLELNKINALTASPPQKHEERERNGICMLKLHGGLQSQRALWSFLNYGIVVLLRWTAFSLMQSTPIRPLSI